MKMKDIVEMAIIIMILLITLILSIGAIKLAISKGNEENRRLKIYNVGLIKMPKERSDAKSKKCT